MAPVQLAAFAADSAAVMTALAGLAGALAAAYKLLWPSPPAAVAEEPEPESDRERLDRQRDERIADLEEALRESRATVHALRGRLDRATLGQQSQVRGPPPDWLSGQ